MQLGLPYESFHPINGGVDFNSMFMLGMRGPFEDFTPISLRDRVKVRFQRWKETNWRLLKRGFRRKRRYFVLW